jgi:ribosome maturation factor RimP
MPPAQAGPPPDAARQQLTGLLAPVVESAGYDLEDVTVTQAGRRSLVRVIIDADGGVDLDAVAHVSRAVSDALDGGDEFAGPFVLEVSSPGVDRPLREPRHWRRATGRLVKADAGGTTLVGRVLDTDDRGVSLDVDGAKRHVPWAGLGPGLVQIEFNRPGTGAGQERG